MSELKTIDEVANWVLTNLLRCKKEVQVSVVAKILQGFTSEQIDQALNMSGVSESVPYVDREKVLEESLSVLLEMASTWGREWFKSETWEKVEKARQVLAGTDR